MSPTKPIRKIFSSLQLQKLKSPTPDLSEMAASIEIQEAPPKGRSKVQVAAIMVALSVRYEPNPHIHLLILLAIDVYRRARSNDHGHGDPNNRRVLPLVCWVYVDWRRIPSQLRRQRVYLGQAF